MSPRPDPLDDVRVAAGALAAAEAALQDRVLAARAEGRTWQEIGDVLGVTRQAAYKRFGHPVDPETGEPLDTRPTADVLGLAEDVVRHLAAGDDAWVRERMTYACARELTRRRLMDVWREVVAAVGEVEDVVGQEVRDTEGARRPGVADPGEPVVVPAVGRLLLEHEAGRMVLHVAVNRDGRVAGLLVGPPEAEASWPF